MLTEADYQRLHEAIREETLVNHLSYPLCRLLLQEMDEVYRSTGEEIFNTDTVTDDAVYVIANGIVRLYFEIDDKEYTFAFGLTGTFFPRCHHRYTCIPSRMKGGACMRDTMLLRMSHDKFERFLDANPEAARWWREVLERQVYDLEDCFIRKSGDAVTRFKDMSMHRPEILHHCPGRYIASYLGITGSYLSTLRSRWSRGLL